MMHHSVPKRYSGQVHLGLLYGLLVCGHYLLPMIHFLTNQKHLISILK
jgi:hypothetical protein